MKRLKLIMEDLDLVIKESVSLIKMGKIVAYPTDTVYGLATDIENKMALEKLSIIKNSRQPMPIIIDTIESAQKIGIFNSVAKKLAELFWPGPLTLVVKGRGFLPELLEHQGKVAVRIPDHIFPVLLARNLNGLLVSTSACPSGMNSPFSPDDVEKILGEKIDLLIDDGPTKYRGPSTVIDTTVNPPKIIRLGVLSPEDIVSLSGIKVSF